MKITKRNNPSGGADTFCAAISISYSPPLSAPSTKRWALTDRGVSGRHIRRMQERKYSVCTAAESRTTNPLSAPSTKRWALTDRGVSGRHIRRMQERKYSVCTAAESRTTNGSEWIDGFPAGCSGSCDSYTHNRRRKRTQRDPEKEKSRIREQAVKRTHPCRRVRLMFAFRHK